MVVPVVGSSGVSGVSGSSGSSGVLPPPSPAIVTMIWVARTWLLVVEKVMEAALPVQVPTLPE